MSRRLKFVLLAIALFVVCVGLVLLTAYVQGIDPLHPRSRHIWLLALITAFYAAIRLAMILDSVLTWREREPSESAGLFGLLKKRNHPIDQRMAERRARVEAAQQKADTQTANIVKENGDG